MIPDWLLAPIDPGRPHQVDAAVARHGRLMTLAWGVLVPAGVVIARYFKIVPGQDWPRELDNRFWWLSHLWLQHAGAALALAAIGLLLAFGPGRGAPAHAALGWTVLVLAALQVLSGWLRGTKGGPTDPRPDGSPSGDHYDMTPRRVAFEAIHRTCGFALLAGGAAAVLTGLRAANAPAWMWIALAGWWAALAAASARWERRGMNAGSYRAIWGPGREHPGNR